MSYSIENLEDHVADPDRTYLIDANIWLKILSPKNKPSSTDSKYVDFFHNIIETKGINIVVPSLIFSEVVNRILRDVHMRKFLKSKGVTNPPPNFYKDYFRPSQEFRTAYMLIADDIKIYLNHVKLINDEFGSKIKFKHVLSHFDFNLDFNDCYYYYLSKKNDYTILTHDKDFCVKGVEVLTLNQDLLGRMAEN